MNFDKQLYESGLIADGCWDQLDDYAKEAIFRFGEEVVKECFYLSRHASSLQAAVLIKTHFGIKDV